MPKGPFHPSEFVPTKFSSAQDKADFGNAFLHFIESEWARTAFSKSFYNRLSMCFGNSAHYNLATFYDTWFASDTDRLEFLRHSLQWPCWGDPEYMFCDVERAIQQEIRKRNYLARYELRAAEAVRSGEIETLRMLEAKYRAVVHVTPDEDLARQVSPASTQEIAITRTPLQGSLF
ncbi:hypothetical protein ACOBR2_01905 [Telmatobacter bradus]|uniref:hypothetical protein n=1 Tax=Telmatobacter bradus TaxID=474953 RepID=UPI003B43CB8F